MSDEPRTDVDASTSDLAELLDLERSLVRTGDDAMMARVHARAKRTLGITPGPSGGGGTPTAMAASTETQPCDVPSASDRTTQGTGLRPPTTYLLPALAAACLLAVLGSRDWATPPRAVAPVAVAPMPPSTPTAASAAPANAPPAAFEIPTLDVDALPSVEEPERAPVIRAARSGSPGSTARPERMTESAAPDDVPPTPPVPTVEAEPAPAGSDIASTVEAEPAPAGSDLASERAVIAELRNAMNAGDHVRAERALEEHARRFPNGQLVEQRKALEVWLFEQTGRRELARERAAQFKSEHPNSVMRRTLGGS